MQGSVLCGYAVRLRGFQRFAHMPCQAFDILFRVVEIRRRAQVFAAGGNMNVAVGKSDTQGFRIRNRKAGKAGTRSFRSRQFKSERGQTIVKMGDQGMGSLLHQLPAKGVVEQIERRFKRVSARIVDMRVLQIR